MACVEPVESDKGAVNPYIMLLGDSLTEYKILLNF